MKFFCRHWYDIGLIAAIVTLVILFSRWSTIDTVTKVLMLSFVAILIHQFEEYGFPGGEPAFMNKLIQPSDIPDRYPLNQRSAMVTNVVVALVYLLAVFFPHAIWLGLGPILMGMMQITVHFIIPAKQYKIFYTPGLGAVICLHWPIGIFYIWYMTTHGGIGLNWVGAIILLAFLMAFVAISTYVIMADRNTEWPFDPKEMERFHVDEMIKEKGIELDPNDVSNPLLKKIRRLNQRMKG